MDTTNIYAEVDLAMKAKALSACSIPDTSRRSWRKEPRTHGLPALTVRVPSGSAERANGCDYFASVDREASPLACKRLRHITTAAT